MSEKAMATTPVLLPGKSHGRRSLIGCSPWGRKESDMTERRHFHFHYFNSVQSLNCAWLCDLMDFSMPGFPVHQFLDLLKRMSIESVMPSNHLILCHPRLLPPSIFPSIRVFSSESVLWIRWPKSAKASILPMNIQDWFPLGWTGWILLSKGLSRVFSNTTVQKHQFFGAQLSSQLNSHIHTWLLEKP